MLKSGLVTLLGLLQTQGIASAAVPSRNTGAAVSIPYQFPNGTWLENMAVRSNGDVLATVLSPHADLYRLPASSGHASAELVHRFPHATSLLGISELCEDEFAMIVGSLDASSNPVPNTFAVWTVQLGRDDGIAVQKAVAIPDVAFPNGMATLDAAAGTVLITDSARGRVWFVNVRTGEQHRALKHPTMNALPDAPPRPIGVNGIRLHAVAGTPVVYYTSTNTNWLGRVPVDRATGHAAGPYETTRLPTGGSIWGTGPDDFAVDHDGTVYLTGNMENQVVRVDPDGHAQTIAGGLKKHLIEGPTSAAFGRLPWDQRTLYVTTSGGSGAPIDGYYEGAKLVKIQVDRL